MGESRLQFRGFQLYQGLAGRDDCAFFHQNPDDAGGDHRADFDAVGGLHAPADDDRLLDRAFLYEANLDHRSAQFLCDKKYR